MSETAWWWSWLLMIVGVSGVYLTGKKLWWGWLVGILSETLWITYAIVTKQYGFLVAGFVYGTVFAINARKWYLIREYLHDQP
jgi:hypothetical protein